MNNYSWIDLIYVIIKTKNRQHVQDHMFFKRTLGVSDWIPKLKQLVLHSSDSTLLDQPEHARKLCEEKSRIM